jgi:hypothetical protein
MLKTKLSICSLTACLVAASGCNQKNDQATTESTGSINSTEVKNQLSSNFCMFYSTLGMLESMYKKKTGKTIVLSPEALAFWRLRKRLHSMVLRAQKENATQARLEEIFKYTWEEGAVFSEVIEMLDLYGVVPETIWKLKINTQSDADLLKAGIKTRLVSAWKKYKGDVSPNIIAEEVMLGDIFVTKPLEPTSPFTFQEKSYTSVDLLKDSIGFSPKEFKGTLILPGVNLSEVMGELKRFIATGIDVPFGIALDNKHIRRDKGVFEKSGEGFNADGFHAMLFSDFVNKGGSLAALPKSELESEASKPYSELDYFYVKNSWGTNLKSGKELPMGGRWILKKSYLDAMLAPPQKIAMAVLFPKQAVINLKLPLCKSVYTENKESCYADK